MKFKTKVKEITPSEVLEILKRGGERNFIDVREGEEIAQGKIPGAQHIPLGELKNRLHEIEKEKEHIVVCRSGNRSGKAAEYLKNKGYEVLNLTGGMMDWTGDLEKE